MRLGKGRLRVVLHIGNKLFPSFGKKKKLKKIYIFWEKILFLKKKIFLVKLYVNLFLKII